MDFDNIFLSTKEKILLFSLHFFKNHKRNLNSPHLKVLLDYELVTLNYLPSSGPDPVPIPDGTVSFTKHYARYKIYRRHKLIDKYLTRINRKSFFCISSKFQVQ